MSFSRNQAESQRMEIDRGAIFIKSISGIHDATIAFGFSNLLSNDAQRHLNNVTGVDQVIDGLTSRYAALAENPFAYKHIAQQLLSWQGESGDAIGRLTGVEAVLAVNGLPLFEFMMPHIDRMITSEYMGTRNLTSSAVRNGNYNVMASGPGYSLPERRGDVQYSFGGSGIPHAEWEKPVIGLFEKGGEEGISFIFKATPDLIKELKMQDILEPGNDILVSHDGIVMSPHLDARYLEIDFGKFTRSMNEYYEQVATLIKDNPAVTSLGDVALFLNGTLVMGEVADMTHKLDNKLGVKDSEAAIYNKIKNKKGKILFQSIHVENTDLRQPKPGLNDWVITRIEKLLDRRRGPVSEMNLLDVIDPQDADFDLDKSSSLHALPGKVLKEIHRVLKPTGQFFLNLKSSTLNKQLITTHRIEFLPEFQKFMMKSYIIWKYSGSFDSTKSRFHLDYEIIYHLSKTDNIEINYEKDEHDPLTSVWMIPHFIKNRLHPVQMPEALAEKIIKRGSKKGEIVLDPFAGSGTSLVVAKKLKRKYIGFELNPKYYEIIKERLK
jgi:SAM-dependent methyltransferase